MDAYPVYRSPPEPTPASRQEPRWGGRDDDVYHRRSPGPVDRRYRPRNRSRSPPPIDRYQPDAYYGGYGRDREARRRPPSPGPANIDRYVPGQDAKPMLVNPIPDPNKLEYQVGFSYFGEWWRHNEAIKEERERQRTGARRPPERLKGDRESREERAKEKVQIQAAYDAYKEGLQVKMAKAFVQSHKGEEWFKERYMPALRDDIRARLNEFRRGNYSAWEHDMEAGVFDEFTLEGIYKGDSNGQGGSVEREEGEAVATAEVLGVGDLLPLKGGNLRDEVALQPALLIKTIAPTVSRAKLEEFCKEHLGEGAGGFRWLSLSDPNPSKRYHRIGWVMLHPGEESGTVSDRGDGRGEEREDGDEGEDDAMREVAAGEGSNNVAEKALEAINGKTIHDETRGDFTVHVGVHIPPGEPRKKALWDLFSVPERIEKDLQLAYRILRKFDQDTDSEYDAIAKIEEKVNQLRETNKLHYGKSSSSKGTKTNEEGGLGEDDELNKVEDADLEEGEDGAFDDEEDDEDLLVIKKKLDLSVEYLRRVYNFCFFCVFESDSVHELARKCPGGHLRRPRASLSSSAKAAAKASVTGEPFPMRKEVKEDGESAGSPKQRVPRTGSKNEQQLQRAFNWVKTFEEKLLQILEPENVDLRKLGGKPIEEALDEELAKYVKQEDENKFRCKVPDCTKLFKAEHFWRKHVEKRHPEWFENLKQELNLVNNYVLDPAHIAPSRSDANSNGHFPTNNQHPSGTPRGFNLSSMPMNFNPALSGGVFPNPAGFPPFFAHHAVQLPGTWGGGNSGSGMPNVDFNNHNSGMGGGDDRHHPGPVRRGNQRNHQHRTGPYDRRGRDMRFNNNSGGPGGGGGRLTPPRGGGAGGGRGGNTNAGGGGAGGNKWGDANVGGNAAVGPREAVQGRSLKSYEDLDAVGGAGGGELNY